MSIQTNILPDNPQIEVIKSGKTGLFTNYIYKAIPLAFDESMSYYETLCGLLHYLKFTIIPTVNNNADAVAELQTLYEELRTYVDDYFKGLDVQEEINNKLDKMVEDGTLQEIISSYLNSKAIFGFDNVASMKQATNLINGSYAKTLGFYNKNDGGNALYKIRQITNEDIVDNATIIQLNNSQLIAELIKNSPVNAKQIGCKTDGTDNSTIINNYLANHNSTGLYFPDGNYTVNNEIDTIGNVIMDSNAWLVAGTQMDCVVHINKNLVIPAGSFANNYPKNQEFKINVDGNKLANTGIRTDKLHWSKLTLTTKNCEVYGVHTRYNTSYGHAENTFDIQTMYDTNDGTNTSTGLYMGDSDDIYNNIVSINTKYCCEIHGGDNSINTIHGWLVNSDLWNGSVLLKISNNKNHISNLIVDTYETGIKFTDDFNLSTGIFNYYIDFMYGMINASFIPAELRSSYKLWDLTGLTGSAQLNSILVIENYIGNDANTAKINLGGNGVCPYNTKLGYSNDYTTPTWSYSLNYCPEGQYYFRGDADVTGKPLVITGGAYIITTKNAPYGKTQELLPSSVSTITGNTTYNTSTCLPSSGFNYFWKRIYNKYGTGTNSWGRYASYYVNETT